MSWVKLRMPGHPKSNIKEKLGPRVAAGVLKLAHSGQQARGAERLIRRVNILLQSYIVEH